MRMRPDGGQIFIGGYDMCNQNSCFGGSSCCWIIIAIILLFLFCGNGCGNGCGCGNNANNGCGCGC